ncbi:Secreted protein [metagenome]|uniref:Secreted protein n=1 Tax=metagenome TaxID=256318 RepID=A0A2P2BYF0_9ZZZZ
MHYSERLSVPLRWWVQGTMLIATLWLAVVVATPPVFAGAVALVAMLLLAAGFVTYGGVRVAVEDGEFRAGGAHIGLEHVGDITALDAEGTRRTAGVDADARAFLLLRPYLKRSVRVEILDPRDPTPYWLVSTRRPDALAAALQGRVAG